MASSDDQKCVSLSCNEGGENWPLETVLVEEEKKEKEEEEEKKEEKEEEEEEGQKKEEEEEESQKKKEEKKKKKKKKKQQQKKEKNQLIQTQIDVHQMILDRMKKIQEIQHSVELRKRNTEEEKSSIVEIFTDLIRSIEKCQSEQLKMMEEQQKAAEKQAEDLIKELQQEITDLKRRNTVLEQLSHTDDHLQLIQMFSSLCSRPNTKNWTEIRIDSDVNVNSLHKALTQVKETQEKLNEKLSQTGLKFVQKFAVDVTLDPETANPYLIISDDGKQVCHGEIEQDVPENPKRFYDGCCVLAKEGFSSGRFYYEVQVKGDMCALGVARESADRKGNNDTTPDNGVWILFLINENVCGACDNPPAFLCLRDELEKVGVFVDYEEGLVSFYEVESRSHIYSYTDQTFTEKLYPYFSPGPNDEDSDTNSNPLIITPVKMN